jgi:competence protein ComEC
MSRPQSFVIALASFLALIALMSGCGGAIASGTVSPRTRQGIDRLNSELASQSNDGWRAHFIDVGQGLAVLHEFPCGAVLMDVGGEEDDKFQSDAALVRYLDAFFARRSDLKGLDGLLLTHPHVDHTRGVQAVLSNYPVRNLVDNGQGSGSGAPGQLVLQQWARDHSDVRYRAIALADIADNRGLDDPILDPVKCPAIDPRITALWGRVDVDPGWPGMRFGKTPFQNGNNHSVVTRVAFGKASGLFTGDLEEPAIRDLLKRYAGTPMLDVDLYQVGHHGAANGTIPELCEAMTPEVAVFSMGPPNWQMTWSAWKYGHPRKDIVLMLQEVMTRKRRPINVQVGIKSETFEPMTVDAALYGTGWDGTVVVEMLADGRSRVLTAGR